VCKHIIPFTNLQDEEAKEWCEVQLAEQWRQDATVDLKVRLSDLQGQTDIWAAKR
jgi:hypothetical protein